MSRIDSRSRLARYSPQDGFAASARSTGRLDKIIGNTRPLGGLHTWIIRLVSRSFSIPRSLPNKNVTAGSRSYSAAFQNRLRHITGDTAGTNSGEADDYSDGNRPALRQLSELARKLNRVEAAHARHRTHSTNAVGTADSLRIQAAPTALHRALAPGIISRRSVFSPARLTRKLASAAAETHALEPPAIFRRLNAMRSANEYEERLRPPLSRPQSPSENQTPGYRTQTGAHLIGAATRSLGRIAPHHSISNQWDLRSYSQASQPDAASGYGRYNRKATGPAMSSVYSRAVQPGSIHFRAEENRALAATTGDRAAGRLHAAQPDLRSFAGRVGGGSSTQQSAANAVDVPSSLIVNFSPSVVINDGGHSIDLENHVVQAIARHSHELARIMMRELQARRRAAFQH